MLVNGKHYRTIWLSENKNFKDLKHEEKLCKKCKLLEFNQKCKQCKLEKKISFPHVCIIDQRLLPHKFKVIKLKTLDDMCYAISDMAVRGAGLIGASAAFGMLLAATDWQKMYFDRIYSSKSKQENIKNFERAMEEAAQKLMNTRPTAVNLAFAVNRILSAQKYGRNIEEKITLIQDTALTIADEDAQFCKRIGFHGLKIIEEIYARTQKPVNILTHCNAGWLAFVDYGSALSPIYLAHEKKIPLHVWVDETRPRNQGASLTAWELQAAGIPHSVIADNVGGHLMQHKEVDMVIVGADRVSRQGDVANKIGTYLKALAAFDNNIPFYVALPSSTFDFDVLDGVKEIPIEQRNADEVKYIAGLARNCKENKKHKKEKKKKKQRITEILLTPEKSPCVNYAFDVTPARLVKALITEKGIVAAKEDAITVMYKERIRQK